MFGQITGFDIGSQELKMVLMAGGKAKKAVCAPLPDHMVEGGHIVSMEAMADFIREQARENGISGGAAAMVLPAAEVVARSLTMPPMTDAQLKVNLPYEFRDYITGEKNAYLFDYSVLGLEQDEDGKARELRLFACMVQKSVVEEYRGMLRRAGFTLKVAVPQEYALSRLLQLSPDHPAVQGDACLVDLGQSGTSIYMFHKGEFSTRRNVDIGLGQLDHDISLALDCDIHVARGYKRIDYNDVLTSKAATEFYGRLTVEIMKAVNFFNYNNRQATLKDVYLFGGGAAIAPLQEAVCSVTHLDVHWAGEFLSQQEFSQEPWQYFQAVGCTVKE